jgi:FtsP/CotA-like multicopper oxidase with cupredoxin domain
MNQLLNRLAALGGVALALWLVATGQAIAAIAGIPGPGFTLTAKADYISTADANSVLTWGYANGAGLMQYPGPTLIVNQGDTVSITLNNTLPVNTSIVFPGQSGVSTNCGVPGSVAGLMSCEALPGGTVTYTFTAAQPGTYLYHSGTQPALQVEMGLVGALIVRPAAPNQAYGHPGSAYDREYLLLLTEMDPDIHQQVAQGNLSGPDGLPVQWFINGATPWTPCSTTTSPCCPTSPTAPWCSRIPARRCWSG